MPVHLFTISDRHTPGRNIADSVVSILDAAGYDVEPVPAEPGTKPGSTIPRDAVVALLGRLRQGSYGDGLPTGVERCCGSRWGYRHASSCPLVAFCTAHGIDSAELEGA